MQLTIVATLINKENKWKGATSGLQPFSYGYFKWIIEYSTIEGIGEEWKTKAIREQVWKGTKETHNRPLQDSFNYASEWLA